MNAVPSSPLLEVAGVRVSYDTTEILKGISLSIGTSDTLAIIGPNGAGKTTMFKAMTGEIPCRAGSIRFKGEDITALPAHLRTRLGLGRTFQVSRVFLGFTALDNVITALESRERNARTASTPWWHWRPARPIVEEAEDLLESLGLGSSRHIPAAALAHGDRKRLELAITLALRPRILMLDEPTAGMAPGDRMEIVSLIHRIRAERGVAVIMTEHDMDVIFNLANQVMVMNYGEIIAKGTVEEVRHNQTVREVYLGKDMYHAAG